MLSKNRLPAFPSLFEHSSYLTVHDDGKGKKSASHLRIFYFLKSFSKFSAKAIELLINSTFFKC
jgi:hypothetical protein